eukprot:CAMPEP_0185010926 /NCGR_PEP_ID=MMETSP1098-20130426/96238_1 /TAXON_ID=89044 /ORGANISM="Spumella elongata, Strain CCAP 955/1" /LENGTH=45 /DNA_ID= /DNA_START= /DNA_END= /DNA_ORIENTATION=
MLVGIQIGIHLGEIKFFAASALATCRSSTTSTSSGGLLGTVDLQA